MLERWTHTDFNEAREVGPFALLIGTEIGGGEEVLALASGPDAEYVLDAAAEVFGQDRAGDTHLTDWVFTVRALGLREAQGLVKEVWEAMR